MSKCLFCNSRKGKRKCLQKGMAEVCSACCGENRTKEGCGGCSYYKEGVKSKHVSPVNIKDAKSIYNEMIGFEKSERSNTAVNISPYNPSFLSEQDSNAVKLSSPNLANSKILNGQSVNQRNYVEVPTYTIDDLTESSELLNLNILIMLSFREFEIEKKVNVKDWLVVRVLELLMDEYYYKDVCLQNEKDVVKECYLFVSDKTKEKFSQASIDMDIIKLLAFTREYLRLRVVVENKEISEDE